MWWKQTTDSLKRGETVCLRESLIVIEGKNFPFQTFWPPLSDELNSHPFPKQSKTYYHISIRSFSHRLNQTISIISLAFRPQIFPFFL